MIKQYNRGFTLVELILVLAILSIVASITMPSSAPQRPYQLELAAQKIANTLRYARDKAINSGQIIGVVIDTDNSYMPSGQQLIKVYYVDPDTAPFTVGATLNMPINKKPYEFFMQNDKLLSSVTLDSKKAFKYFRILSESVHVHFDQSGIPKIFNKGVGNRLLYSEILLTTESQSITVVLHAVTGRVTIHE